MSKLIEIIEEKLRESDVISDFQWLSENVLDLHRCELPTVRACILFCKTIKETDVTPYFGKDIVAIIKFPNSVRWRGDAINACENQNIVWGRLGDLLNACELDEPRKHKHIDTRFPRRIIEQHSDVKLFQYDYDCIFRVTLNNNKNVLVACVQNYDVSAEQVRSLKSKFGDFDLLLVNNPAAHITKEARAAAKSIGVNVLDSRGLLAVLGRIAKR